MPHPQGSLAAEHQRPAGQRVLFAVRYGATVPGTVAECKLVPQRGVQEGGPPIACSINKRVPPLDRQTGAEGRKRIIPLVGPCCM